MFNGTLLHNCNRIVFYDWQKAKFYNVHGCGGSGLNLVLRFAHIRLGHVYRVGNYGILETNIFKQLNVRFPCVLS